MNILAKLLNFEVCFRYLFNIFLKNTQSGLIYLFHYNIFGELIKFGTLFVTPAKHSST